MKRSILVVALGGSLVAGCTGPEYELVNRFFEATQRGDGGMLANLGTVRLGDEVEEWEILEVSPEASGPYEVPVLRAQVDAAEGARDEQFKVFGKFRADNYDQLVNIQKRLRQDPDAAFRGRQAELRDRWETFRLERREKVRELQHAEDERREEIRRVTMSLQRESTPEYLSGSTLTGKARVRVLSPSGEREVVLTLTRYELVNQFDTAIPSRWIVTGIDH